MDLAASVGAGGGQSEVGRVGRHEDVECLARPIEFVQCFLEAVRLRGDGGRVRLTNTKHIFLSQLARDHLRRACTFIMALLRMGTARKW
jgi:hypothetical protein